MLGNDDKLPQATIEMTLLESTVGGDVPHEDAIINRFHARAVSCGDDGESIQIERATTHKSDYMTARRYYRVLLLLPSTFLDVMRKIHFTPRECVMRKRSSGASKRTHTILVSTKNHGNLQQSHNEHTNTTRPEQPTINIISNFRPLCRSLVLLCRRYTTCNIHSMNYAIAPAF